MILRQLIKPGCPQRIPRARLEIMHFTFIIELERIDELKPYPTWERRRLGIKNQ